MARSGQSMASAAAADNKTDEKTPLSARNPHSTAIMTIALSMPKFKEHRNKLRLDIKKVDTRNQSDAKRDGLLGILSEDQYTLIMDFLDYASQINLRHTNRFLFHQLDFMTDEKYDNQYNIAILPAAAETLGEKMSDDTSLNQFYRFTPPNDYHVRSACSLYTLDELMQRKKDLELKSLFLYVLVFIAIGMIISDILKDNPGLALIKSFVSAFLTTAYKCCVSPRKEEIEMLTRQIASVSEAANLYKKLDLAEKKLLKNLTSNDATITDDTTHRRHAP